VLLFFGCTLLLQYFKVDVNSVENMAVIDLEHIFRLRQHCGVFGKHKINNQSTALKLPSFQNARKQRNAQNCSFPPGSSVTALRLPTPQRRGSN